MFFVGGNRRGTPGRGLVLALNQEKGIHKQCGQLGTEKLAVVETEIPGGGKGHGKELRKRRSFKKEGKTATMAGPWGRTGTNKNEGRWGKDKETHSVPAGEGGGGGGGCLKYHH